MNSRILGLSALLLTTACFTGCGKQAPPPPPAPQQVAAPTPSAVPPGMEAQNPAEKEGQP